MLELPNGQIIVYYLVLLTPFHMDKFIIIGPPRRKWIYLRHQM